MDRSGGRRRAPRTDDVRPGDRMARTTSAPCHREAARPPTAPDEPGGRDRSSNLAAPAAIRFCAVYFVLCSFATQIAGGLILFPDFSFPSLGTRWPMRAITEGLAAHLFRIRTPLVYSGNSGDTAFHWIQTFWLLVLSLVTAMAWIGLERRRGSDV